MTPTEIVAGLSESLEAYYQGKSERKESAEAELRERAARFIHALILDPWAAKEAKQLWRRAHPEVEMWPYLPQVKVHVEEHETEEDE